MWGTQYRHAEMSFVEVLSNEQQSKSSCLIASLSRRNLNIVGVSQRLRIERGGALTSNSPT